MRVQQKKTALSLDEALLLLLIETTPCSMYSLLYILFHAITFVGKICNQKIYSILS